MSVSYMIIWKHKNISKNYAYNDWCSASRSATFAIEKNQVNGLELRSADSSVNYVIKYYSSRLQDHLLQMPALEEINLDIDHLEKYADLVKLPRHTQLKRITLSLDSCTVEAFRAALESEKIIKWPWTI